MTAPLTRVIWDTYAQQFHLCVKYASFSRHVLRYDPAALQGRPGKRTCSRRSIRIFFYFFKPGKRDYLIVRGLMLCTLLPG
jgi:hypothetical protein